MKTTPTRILLSPLLTALLLRLCVLLLGCGVCTHAQEAESRITIAVLPFEDQTKDEQEAHWRHSLSRMICRPMYPVKQVRIYGADAMEYGLRRCHLKSGDPIREEQAKTIGEIIEARRVVWGHYRKDGKKWTVTVRVMVVSEGACSGPISATSDDWFTLSQELAEKILTELKVAPTAEQRKKMQYRYTDSAEALEYYSRCYALMTDQKSFEEVAQMAQKAIKVDPKFAEAYVAYGSCLFSQGKFKEGRVQVEKALELKPDNDRAILALGVLCGLENDTESAAKHLREAARLDPDEPENFVRLAELYMMMKEYDSAVAQLETALRLNPVSASANAQLGFCYALMAKKEPALRAMERAVSIDADDAAVYQILAQGYDRLGMTSQAIEYREKLLASGKKIGLNPAMLVPYQKRLEELRTSLRMESVTAAEPRRYSDEQLRKELRERLTAEEYSQLLFPLECTAEMKQWAKELTKDAKDDMAKARALYDALASHLSPAGGGARTAAQVFEQWKSPDASFQCQEYARLYVALAREVGLGAYFTRVDRDHEDQVVLHACAALFLHQKVILVDVTYRWFGVPHKKFAVYNDYEAIAMQMNQSDGLTYKRIAVKLQPDDLALYNLAGRLMGENQIEEAKGVLERFFQTKAEPWMKHSARGSLAWMEKNWDLAEKELKQSIEIHPYESSVHYHLGLVLLQKEDLPGALESLRRCMEQRTSSEMEMKCRRLIALIHERMPDANPASSLTPLQQWHEALKRQTHASFPFFEWSPRIHAAVGLVYDLRPEALAIEIKALRARAEKEPENALCRLRIGVLLQLMNQPKEADVAMMDAQRVARAVLGKRPGNPDASYVLVCCLHGNEESGTIAKKVAEMHPSDWRALMGSAHHQSELFMRALFEGLENLPPQGYDLARAEEAISMRSSSVSQCLKLINMIHQTWASADKAVACSKGSAEALIHLLGVRSNLGLYLMTLQKMATLTVDETMEFSTTNVELLKKLMESSQDEPEILAATTLIAVQSIMTVEELEQGASYDAAEARKKALAAVAPAMKRLLQLSEGPDAPKAAVAYEGYASLLVSQIGAGYKVELPDNLAERLDKARSSAPHRLILWDLRIVHDATKAELSQANIEMCHELALKRNQICPTSRGYAILAATSRTPGDEMMYWEKAATMEPEQLFYALNFVAAKMRVDSTETGLADALKRLQEIGDFGYDNGYWQLYPQYNLFRQRLFIIQQALSGKIDGARRAIDQILQSNPTDASVIQLGDLLNNKPES